MGVILTPTMARAPGPPSSLRMKLLLVLLAAGVYAGAPPVYLLFRARAAIVAGDDLLARQRALQAAAGGRYFDLQLGHHFSRLVAGPAHALVGVDADPRLVPGVDGNASVDVGQRQQRAGTDVVGLVERLLEGRR